jgi:ribosomal protein L11 methyltransferase
VLYRLEAPLGEWDRLIGELHERGTLGVEECSEPSPPQILAYFDARSSHVTVPSLADGALGIVVRGPERVEEEDWGERWRQGLRPRQVGPLWIRPSWSEPMGELELELDPGRAFGSGEHASTRLALRLLLDELRAGDTVLDVGTGTGILALGALRVGAARAVGLDIDPVACESARANAARNQLGLGVLCGGLGALRSEARFDLVVANLLLSRLTPLLARLVSHSRRRCILAGYLESEWPQLQAALEPHGVRVVRTESEVQPDGSWSACVVAQARDRQSSSRSRSVSSSE